MKRFTFLFLFGPVLSMAQGHHGSGHSPDHSTGISEEVATEEFRSLGPDQDPGLVGIVNDSNGASVSFRSGDRWYKEGQKINDYLIEHIDLNNNAAILSKDGQSYVVFLNESSVGKSPGSPPDKRLLSYQNFMKKQNRGVLGILGIKNAEIFEETDSSGQVKWIVRNKSGQEMLRISSLERSPNLEDMLKKHELNNQGGYGGIPVYTGFKEAIFTDSSGSPTPVTFFVTQDGRLSISKPLSQEAKERGKDFGFERSYTSIPAFPASKVKEAPPMWGIYENGQGLGFGPTTGGGLGTGMGIGIGPGTGIGTSSNGYGYPSAIPGGGFNAPHPQGFGGKPSVNDSRLKKSRPN